MSTVFLQRKEKNAVVEIEIGNYNQWSVASGQLVGWVERTSERNRSQIEDFRCCILYENVGHPRETQHLTTARAIGQGIR